MSLTEPGSAAPGIDRADPTRYEWRITARPGSTFLDILANVVKSSTEGDPMLERIRRLKSPVLRRLSIIGFTTLSLFVLLVLAPAFVIAAFEAASFYMFVLTAWALDRLWGVGDQVAFYWACAYCLLSPYYYWRWSRGTRRRKGDLGMARTALLIVPAAVAYVAASPMTFLSQGFQGDIHSSWQWALFLVDQGLNVIYFGVPTYCFGSLSSIVAIDWQARAAVALMRITLTYGVFQFMIALIKPTIHVLLLAQNEDYYVGTVKALYLYLLGKDAFNIGNYRGQESLLVIARLGTVTTSSAVETIEGGQLAKLFLSEADRK